MKMISVMITALNARFIVVNINNIINFAPSQNHFEMEKPVFNPFKNRDPKEVWDEIRRTKQPISKEEALKQMQQSSSMNPKK